MAAPSSLTVRINLKVVLIVLAIAVPLLLADMFLVLDRSSNALTATIGTQTEALAKVTAGEVHRWIRWKVNEVQLLVATSELRRALLEANRRYAGMSEGAVQAMVMDTDRDWETPKVAPLVSRMLSTPASVFLKNHTALDPSFRRFLVADARGAAVAGSHKSIDYNQSDEPWWTTSFGDGRTGRIYVEDVRFDPITRTNFVPINAPILDPEKHQVIGVLRAVVDVTGMTPIVSQIQLGKTGQAMLVKADGTVICSRDAALDMNRKAEEIEALRSSGDRASGYIGLLMSNRQRRFVGFADTDLTRPFPELRWTVIVSQDFEEAMGPIRTINRRVLLSAFVAMGLVAILAVYFSTHRPPEITDLEEVERA